MHESSILSTSTKIKIIMKYLYEKLDELINTIKYSHEAGNETPDYLDDEYFLDVVEACKEIVDYTK